VDENQENRCGGFVNGTAIVDIPLTPHEALVGLRCEEANALGVMHAGEPVPCGGPAVAIVWHGRPGERQYAMCAGCAIHNVKNRGARLLLITNPLLRNSLMRYEYDGRADDRE